MNGSGFFFWQRTIPPLGPGQSGMSCRMAACPQSQRRKIGVFFRKLAYSVVQGYAARLPGEGKGVLNKRERNVLDIHYGLMKAPPLKQISGWAFGFGSVCISVWRSVSLSVCQSVCLSGTATFFFLPDALSVSWNNMFCCLFLYLGFMIYFLFSCLKIEKKMKKIIVRKRG